MKIRRNVEGKGDAGTVGIGTLIVFIAMVLVAAIAAAIIIKTAIILKNQAEDTGEGAQQEVSGFLKIHGMVGIRQTGDTGLRAIEIHASAFHGSHGIKLKNMIIHLTAASNTLNINQDAVIVGSDWNSAILAGAQFGDPALANYNITEVLPQTPTTWTAGQPDTWTLDEDIVIVIRVEFDPTTSQVPPQTEITLNFIPGNGPAWPERITTPSSYTGNYIPLT